MQKMTQQVESHPLDLEHELAASNDHNDSESKQSKPYFPEAPDQVPFIREEPSKVAYETVPLRERLARMQAEFENARKRLVREQQEFREYALFDAIQTLLPVLDGLEQAQRATPLENTHSRCIELIQKQLLEALAKIGVRPIHAKGQPFNPALHQAIATVETNLVEDQLIVDELQRGYLFKDRLLRPSMVKVAKRHRE